MKKKFKKYELWNMDTVMAKKLVPCVRAFRKSDLHCYPGDLNSLEEWKKILKKIEKGLLLLSREGSLLSLVEGKKVKEATRLLGKYFTNFWD